MTKIDGKTALLDEKASSNEALKYATFSVAEIPYPWGAKNGFSLQGVAKEYPLPTG